MTTTYHAKWSIKLKAFTSALNLKKQMRSRNALNSEQT